MVRYLASLWALLMVATVSHAETNIIQLNQMIAAKGAKWQAGESAAVEQFRNVPFGLAGGVRGWQTTDSYDQSQRTPGLQAQLDWRNHQGKNWMSPVRN